ERRPAVRSRTALRVSTVAVAGAIAATLAISLPVMAATPAAVASRSSRAVARGAGAAARAAAPGRAHADSTAGLTLKGGEEGTVFRTLTVEGEDRIHIEVERPVLALDGDPERAQGLDRGSVRDVLDRTTPDFVTPLLAISASQTAPWVAHPWLSHFSQGAVARFRPAVSGVERWRLVVVSARAESVAVFQGKGDPPREIAWDGRSASGAPVSPGVRYSYVFEARDKAGNKRNFVGEGFGVSAFRYGGDADPVLVFSGRELARPGGGSFGADEAPPIVIEAATAMNQAAPGRRVVIEVTARSREEADQLSARLVRWMSPNVL